jgi:hypothetical protein
MPPPPEGAQARELRLRSMDSGNNTIASQGPLEKKNGWEYTQINMGLK